MTTDPTPANRTAPALAEAYFPAWSARDGERLRGLLADDVTFRGPLGSADGAQECVDGLMGMAQILERIEVVARVASGDDVITWFDLHTRVADPATTANWMHVVDGSIASIRVTFDPRGILAAG